MADFVNELLASVRTAWLAGAEHGVLMFMKQEFA